jgi:2'-5' RNA ligase
VNGASQERARLFVALALPADVRAALFAWAAGPVASLRLRAVAEDSLHVTLCFLGSLPVASIAEVAGALRAVSDLRGAWLTPAGAVWLPPRRPGVLAVRLSDEGGRLGRAQAALSAALERGGWYVPERRAFLPHVTVARVRRGTSGLPRDPPAGPALPAFAGSGVTLLRSRLSAAGARYEALASVQLNGAC